MTRALKPRGRRCRPQNGSAHETGASGRRFPPAAVLMVLLVLSTGSPAWAGVEQVRAGVDGLACPFCAYNVEKRVKTLEGVSRKGAFTVSVEKGLATFAWMPGVAFDPEAVRDQVRRAGFTPGTIRITATGTVTLTPAGKAKPRDMALLDPQTKQFIPIRPAKRADRLESYEALKAKALMLGDKKPPLRVRVRGDVQAGRLWHLVLDRWEPLHYGLKVIVDVETLACERCATRVMRALAGTRGVLHVEADHKENRVWLWMREKAPETEPLRARIDGAGFKVTRVRTAPATKGQGGHD